MFVLELIGAAAFAISGAMAAIKRKADIFGVVFLGVITALGGGVIRDVLIGQLPPKMFVSYAYLLASLLVSLIVFFDAYIRREKYFANKDKLSEINNIFDAAGLAVFTISGMNTAMGVSDNVILILTLGVITGVGGGMLRDMMTNTMPKVLRKRVYAVASLIGGALYYVLHLIGVNDILSAVIGMVTIFVLRVLATAYKWNLPSVKFD
ncbi:MAG: trimeric intracellular cation channel family protein [Oscillospiraceae bacterium]|nr:trimeric intracellular cation channel family protein [Oscillospiraceae bacterium]